MTRFEVKFETICASVEEGMVFVHFGISKYLASYLVDFSTDKYPQIEVTFAGKHINHKPELIDVEKFVPVKNPKNRGRRLSLREIGSAKFAEPLDKHPAANGRNTPPPDITEGAPIQISENILKFIIRCLQLRNN
jgi:hypothetical protein